MVVGSLWSWSLHHHVMVAVIALSHSHVTKWFK
jgi:hypothetical protein